MRAAKENAIKELIDMIKQHQEHACCIEDAEDGGHKDLKKQATRHHKQSSSLKTDSVSSSDSGSKILDRSKSIENEDKFVQLKSMI